MKKRPIIIKKNTKPTFQLVPKKNTKPTFQLVPKNKLTDAKRNQIRKSLFYKKMRSLQPDLTLSEQNRVYQKFLADTGSAKEALHQINKFPDDTQIMVHDSMNYSENQFRLQKYQYIALVYEFNDEFKQAILTKQGDTLNASNMAHLFYWVFGSDQGVDNPGGNGQLLAQDVIFIVPLTQLSKSADLDLDELMADSELGHCVLGNDGVGMLLDMKIANVELSKISQARKNQKIKEYQKLKDYFNELGRTTYVNGISINQIDALFKEHHIICHIDIPHMNQKITVGFKPAGTSRSNHSVKFTYFRGNHLEINLSDYAIIGKSETDFENLLHEIKSYPKVAARVLHLPDDGKQTLSGVYWKNTLFVRQRFLPIYENNNRLIYDWCRPIIRYAIPINLPIYQFVRCGMHVPLRFKTQELRTGLYAQDMKKSYASFAKNVDYNGFPAMFTHYSYDPTLEDQQNLGYWLIETTEELPLMGNPSGIWPNMWINLFRELNLDFKVKFGTWSLNKIPEDLVEFSDEILDQKLYTIAIGMLSKNIQLEHKNWIASAEMMALADCYANPIDKNMFKTLIYHGKESRSAAAIAGYYYGYAGTTIYRRALEEHLKGNLVAVNIDEIITVEPPSKSDLFKDPIIIDDIISPGEKKSKFQKLIDTKGWVSCKTEIDFNKLELTDKINVSMINNKFRDECKGTILFQLPKHQRSLDGKYWYFGGAGGTGKTYNAHEIYSWIGCTYVTLTNKLVDKKELAEFKEHQCETLHSFCLKQFQREHNVVIIDETTLMPEKLFQTIKDTSAVQVYCGDRAQIAGFMIDSKKRHQDLIDLCNYREFTHDYRSKDEKIMRLKAKLRELVLKDHITNLDVKKFLEYYFKPTDHVRGLLLGLTNITNKKHNGKTPDSAQGDTIYFPNEITILTGICQSRQNEYKQLMYTAVSRVEYYDQVFIIKSGDHETGLSRPPKK